MKKVFLLCFTAFMAWACNNSDAPKTESLKPVKVIEISDLSVVEKSYTGIVNSGQTSDLAFKVSGLVQKTYISKGVFVNEGDLLMELDPQDIKMDNEAKKASFATQQEALKRAERLLERDAISKQEYEATLASYENAKAAYEISSDNLKETKLRAPFSGFILERYANAYNRVQAGQPVVALVNPNKIEINFTVPESNAKDIAPDNEIYVEFDTYKGVQFKCKLKNFVATSADGAGIPVVLTIDDPKFSLKDYKVAVGYSCRVIINITNGELNGIFKAPISAIVADPANNNSYIMVYDESTSAVKRVNITYDSTLLGEGEVAIKGNIKPKDKVVVAGATLLSDGQKVKLLDK